MVIGTEITYLGCDIDEATSLAEVLGILNVLGAKSEGISGKNIKVYKDGVAVGDAVTNQYGQFAVSGVPAEGISSETLFKAVFIGDDIYASASSVILGLGAYARYEQSIFSKMAENWAYIAAAIAVLLVVIWMMKRK